MNVGWMRTLQTLWISYREIVLELEEAQNYHERPELLLKRLKMNLHHRLASPYPGDRRGFFKGRGLIYTICGSINTEMISVRLTGMCWLERACLMSESITKKNRYRSGFLWMQLPPCILVKWRVSWRMQSSWLGFWGILGLEMGNRVGLVLWHGAVTPRLIPPKSTETNLQWILQEIDTAMAGAWIPTGGLSRPDSYLSTS